jgi:1-acyl-sn-glycerol-3-phosphate acyltransferase
LAKPLYLTAGTLYTLLAAAKRQRVTGRDSVPPGGFVLAANHLSNIDPFTVGWCLWPRRQVWYMAKAELFNPWLAPAMRAIATFPVRRGEPDAEALRTALDLLRRGEIVGMFPEGTRRKKGLRKKFAPAPHTGTARIALMAGVPLVPVGVTGTDRLFSAGRISVAFGAPIPLDDLAGMPRKRAAEVATERLMAAIEQLVSGSDQVAT